tara:strand:- start:611 stop:910 length:300 start_codon:yes stop_codon:yes gene_type:complete
MIENNKTQKAITDESVNESLTDNPMLSMIVEKDSALKEYLVEYVGAKLDQEDVTVHMIAEVLASEFPEFLFPIAEENFLRGYQVGLDDAKLLETQTPAE